MVKEYLIDGYNLLLRWRRGSLKRGPGNLERAREALLLWLARRIGHSSDVTVVFDASRTPRAGLADSHVHGIRVVFSEGFASADDWIIRECESRIRDKSLVVVSSDRAVQRAAERLKLSVIGSDRLIADLYQQESREEEEPEPARPEPTVPGALSIEDLEEFRQAMASPKQVSVEEPSPRSSSPPESPPSKDSSPSAKPSKRTESVDDLGDFYREMREFDPPA